MSAPTSGVGGGLRRNPRRRVAIRNDADPVGGPPIRPRPHGRVTRSSQRLLSALADNQDNSNNASDEASDDESFEVGSHRLRKRPRFSPPSLDAPSSRTRSHGQSPSRTDLQSGSRHNTTTLSEGAETLLLQTAPSKTRSSARLARRGRESPRRNHHMKASRSGTVGGQTSRKSRASRAVGQSTSTSTWQPSSAIPPWDKLEWTILVQILQFASFPLDNRASLRWLLSAGLTCKAFLEPAYKVLYSYPPPLPIISMHMAHKFAHLMRQLAADTVGARERQDHRRTMVESIVIDVSSLTNTPYQGHIFDVAELIQNLPSLAHIELFHQFDLPPYRQLDVKGKKWTYSPELLEALRVVGEPGRDVRLKSWKWSERLMDGNTLPIDRLKAVHALRAFSYLKKVSLVNFQVPSLRENKDPGDPAVFEADLAFVKTAAESLNPLTNLKHLVMESSTIVDGQFLSLLPRTIKHLEIVNCWELTAEHLAQYLQSHGTHLQQLTLYHNQSLSLAFLPDLGRCCPRLREIRMDLTYYNHHEYYHDSDPIYDALLTVTDVPSWPGTIEVIELEQLSKWDPNAADMFFQSFVDQAPQMPNLRYLSIKAMLDVSWRQRCEFRDKWVGTLTKIFLGKYSRPKPYHSLTQWPQIKGGLAEVSHEDVAYPSSPAREAETPRTPSRGGSVARDLRKPKRTIISYRDPDTDEDLDDVEESKSEGEGVSPLTTPPDSPSGKIDVPFVQGKCKVVNIRIDNQKPREFQWAEEDFLDEEQDSDDDEWTAARERSEANDDHYAW